ncbi:MAG: hypothetical protein Ct9H300mP30_2370 [Methanobacteriota archaeon]|nr:MAG: hypothetical protein Ct9H300mP30_2370 [Euryarchaeota archaeon]
MPRTLAENSGLDPIDEILELSAAQAAASEGGAWIGMDVVSGDKVRMDETGVFDPLFCRSPCPGRGHRGRQQRAEDR